MTYEILHGEKLIASITLQGECEIYEDRFMPCNLYLEETDELDQRVDNVTNFYYWCATRVLTLDRKYAKEILNSMGMGQAVTDRERARVALSYHCLSLTDIYWVREAGEQITFAKNNLFEHHLSNAFVDVALRGRQKTVQDAHLLAGDTSTNGCFPKAWVREADGVYLLKDGDQEAALEAVRQIGLNQVEEIEGEWFGENAGRREMFWRRMEILRGQEKE